MTIKIRLFAILRERAGVSELTLDLPDGATVATARAALLKEIPSLGGSMPRVAFAVNQNYALLTSLLEDGDEVAIIPPVSGG